MFGWNANSDSMTLKCSASPGLSQVTIPLETKDISKDMDLSTKKHSSSLCEAFGEYPKSTDASTDF